MEPACSSKCPFISGFMIEVVRLECKARKDAHILDAVRNGMELAHAALWFRCAHCHDDIVALLIFETASGMEMSFVRYSSEDSYFLPFWKFSILEFNSEAPTARPAPDAT